MWAARSLARSTPFRLAVTFAAFLILAFLLAGIVVYQLMDSDLTDRVDEDLQKTYSLLSATYDQNDQEDLVSTVRQHAALSTGGNQLFGLVAADGTRLAGTLNVPPGARIPGFATVSSDELGQNNDDPYRVLSGKVGPNTLILAFSYGDTNELRMIVLSGFAWATIIVAVLAVAGGALVAARIQRRLDAIASTMHKISQGRLDARIPLIGNQDDVDAVSSQVNAALDRIVALMEGLRQVGYDIAHDLRTPLNRLRIALDSAVQKADAPAIVADLEEATAELERTTQTFDALLRIAQIEAGARRARFQSLDLGEVIGSVHEIYEEVAIDHGKTISTKVDPVPTLQGDRELLVQLFANLVENALRHTPSGVDILIGCSKIGSQIQVSVADNGPGIPAQERGKVFQRLYRMDKSRTSPGNGLGLSMVKAIADLHGASVTLGDAGPGLIVTVTFQSP
ncbi:HAMP domain-containing histidine kinase [Mesorhizobium sp. AR07]|uniref:sensor histidine kinase n=1 Tax=Mesorhizobium sp. AR07 TaxID=2865838 RepID=UPI00215EB617|nr:HAMP domain-containing sensor histidine kinase [Mesorhizobium sp. AR07]UVK43017.1 HAMP domain-containing histidine kinase [Mesorhizobium sp. AR07]